MTRKASHRRASDIESSMSLMVKILCSKDRQNSNLWVIFFGAEAGPSRQKILQKSIILRENCQLLVLF